MIRSAYAGGAANARTNDRSASTISGSGSRTRCGWLDQPRDHELCLRNDPPLRGNDSVRQVRPALDPRPRCVHDHRGAADPGEGREAVGLAQRRPRLLERGAQRPPAVRPIGERRELVAERPFEDALGLVGLEDASCPPPSQILLEAAEAHPERRATRCHLRGRVVGEGPVADHRVKQDQAAARRARRRERGDRAADREPEQDRPAELQGVAQRPQVLHVLLDRVPPRRLVAEPVAAQIHGHEADIRRQALGERGERIGAHGGPVDGEDRRLAARPVHDVERQRGQRDEAVVRRGAPGRRLRFITPGEPTRRFDAELLAQQARVALVRRQRGVGTTGALVGVDEEAVPFLEVGIDRDELRQRPGHSLRRAGIGAAERVPGDRDRRLAEDAPESLLFDVQPGVEDGGRRDRQPSAQVPTVEGEHVRGSGVVRVVDEARGAAHERPDVRRPGKRDAFRSGEVLALRLGKAPPQVGQVPAQRGPGVVGIREELVREVGTKAGPGERRPDEQGERLRPQRERPEDPATARARRAKQAQHPGWVSRQRIRKRAARIVYVCAASTPPPTGGIRVPPPAPARTPLQRTVAALRAPARCTPASAAAARSFGAGSPPATRPSCARNAGGKSERWPSSLSSRKETSMTTDAPAILGDGADRSARRRGCSA